MESIDTNEERRQKQNAYARDYYQRNLEKKRERGREYSKQWRAKNLEKAKATQQRYQQNHPDRLKETQRKYGQTDKRKQSFRRYYERNKDEISESGKIRREKQRGDPRHQRRLWNNYLKKQYGITADQYDLLLSIQKGVCAICSMPETTKRNGKTKRLAVDHDHATGAIRGLLCAACNTFIGLSQESLETLNNVLLYVEKTTDGG